MPTMNSFESTASGASGTPHHKSQAADLLVRSALAVAVLGTVGSLLLSLGLGLKACPLCFYQRTFMMSVMAVLGMGLVLGSERPGRLCLLALPLAVAGLGVAMFH